MVIGEYGFAMPSTTRPTPTNRGRTRRQDSLGAHFKRVTAPLLTEMEDIRTTLASQKFDELDVDVAVSYLESMFWNLLNLWPQQQLGTEVFSAQAPVSRRSRLQFWSVEPKSTSSLVIVLAEENVDENTLVSPKRFELLLSP